MRGITSIPDKIDSMYAEDIPYLIDTKGFNCKMKVVYGDIDIMLEQNSDKTFPLLNGESFDFCGKIYVKLRASAPMVCLMYYHTL